MKYWLVPVAVAPLFAATAAQAQMRGLAADPLVSVAHSRALDWRLSQQRPESVGLPLVRGMIVQRSIMPNGIIGVGLANMYARKKGSSARIDERPRHSRKPAVTFVLNF